MTRVLVVSSEPVGGRMAGPAIRAWELARALSASCEVTLAAPGPSSAGEAPVAMLEAGLEDFELLRQALTEHDVVVAQRLPSQLLRHIRRLPVRYVADLYNPIVVEVLEAVAHAESARGPAAVHQTDLTALAQLAAADFVICASEKQRDMWLGGMALTGLLDPRDYAGDRTYRSFVDVVPFGVPDRPPRATSGRLREIWPAIGPDDPVLLWGGGIWRWLDALTPIRAMKRMVDAGRPVHLVFMGVERPQHSPGEVPSAAGQAIELARRLGLEGRNVHFGRGWVPYSEREALLLDADLGISAHPDHLETRFSFRTRILDYLWAGLPVVTTEGDSVAELVEVEELGATVTAGGDAAFAEACAELLDDPARRDAIRDRAVRVCERLRWSRAVEPLVRFCAEAGERPAPRGRRVALALSSFGQYPLIAADRTRREGLAETARSARRLVARALRHRDYVGR